MIGHDQNQRTGDNSTAIQAKGDVHVGADISVVMAAVSQSIQIHTEAARGLVNDRLNEFERRLTEKFSLGDHSATQTFADPDMQGALFDAQKAFIRSDSQDLHEVLTNLIYKRALEGKRNRVSLVIDDAISKSARLTRRDFATLALLFYILECGITGKITPQSLGERFQSHIDPILDDVDLSTESLGYLYSQGLFLTSPIDPNVNPNPLSKVVASKYSEVLNTGFSIEEISGMGVDHNILTALNILQKSEISEGLYYISQTNSGISSLAFKVPLIGGLVNRYKSETLGRQASNDVTHQIMLRYHPRYDDLVGKYDGSRAGAVNLSATAIAIAHAYISAETNFDGALGVWIK